MEENKLFNKISSKYILYEIFAYIEIPDFKYKLLFYSKEFQKKIGLELFDYQEKFIKKRIATFNISSLLYDKNFNSNYDKEHLNNKIEPILDKLNLNKKSIESFILSYYKKYWKKIKEKNNNGLIDYFSEEIPIEIFSPFFQCISKSEIFDKIFTIFLPINLMKSFDIQKDYNEIFEKLEESNINSFSIRFLFKINRDIIPFKQLKINFSKIKRLFILEQDCSEKISKDLNDFYEELFLINNIANNLLYLKISNLEFQKINSFNNINNFKFLEQLHLSGFNFQNIIKLKLNNLKIVTFEKCDNITFHEDYCFNIKFLSLKNCTLPTGKELLQFKNLEKLILYSDKKIDRQNYNLIFDFSVLVNLLDLSCETIDFIYLTNLQKLEKLNIYSDTFNTIENEKLIIEKICSIRNIKEVSFYLKEITNNEISEIKGINNSVTSLTINWTNKENDCILFGLQNKFPSLANINLNLYYITPPYYYYYVGFKSDLEFKYNALSRIKNININGAGNLNLKLYCKYESLESLNIRVRNDIKNLNDGFPFFKEQCQIIFENLISFEFTVDNYCLINEDSLINLYNNIDNMPKLKTFILKCIVRTLNEKFKNDFLQKIKSLKLDLYSFSINKFY